MLIGVDVDEVCADMLTEWIRRYNIRWDDHLQRSDITAWDIRKFAKPECGSKIYDILHEGNLYEDVAPIPGALWAVRALKEMGHRVVYISSCVEGAVDHKIAWLVKHKFLPDKRSQPDFIAAVEKWLVKADLLIDDNAETIAKFPGLRMLVDQPHNRQVEGEYRIKSLADAPAAVAILHGGPRPPAFVVKCS